MPGKRVIQTAVDKAGLPLQVDGDSDLQDAGQVNLYVSRFEPYLFADHMLARDCIAMHSLSASHIIAPRSKSKRVCAG